MANAARMIRLLGGPQARARVFSFRHAQLGTDAAYREALGCTVRFGRTWCGFEVDHRLAGRPIDHADPETKRIATKYLESQYLPSDATLSERVVGLAAACCRPANAAPRPSPTNSTCTHERCSGAWLPRASGAMTSSSANAVRKRQGTSPNRGCI